MPEYRDRRANGSIKLGVLHAHHGRDHEARDAFERAHEIQLRLTKDFPDISGYRHNLAAHCYSATVNLATLSGHDERDAQRARELAREAVAIEPEEAGFWKALALAEYRAGDLESALKAETKALELRNSKGYSYDWLILALIHLGRGDREQARAWAERVYGGRAPGSIPSQEPDFTRLARESEPRLRKLLSSGPESPP